MFYTGTSRGESLRRQRIGLATSTDLHDWRRFDGNPVLDLDPRHYEEYDPALWHDRSLRDPWVAPDPTGSGFRMWFTARAKTGPADGRGVIGTAWSADLLSWRTEPPVTPAGDFGECEVPQYFSRGERHYLLFSTSARRTSSRRLEQLAKKGSPVETGTHYFVADRPSGPWRLGPMPFLAGEAVGSLYAGRVVEGRDRAMFFLGFQGDQRDGTFAGTISDPIPVEIGEDGRLMLNRLAE